MLHGYHHDEGSGRGEFSGGHDLAQKVIAGRKYLEDLLGASIRVFVAPKNIIGRRGLRAISRAGLHLGGTAGMRAGWSPFSSVSWRTWSKLRSWRTSGGLGVPWVLDLGDHREIAGNSVTPSASFGQNIKIFNTALAMGGVFCAFTHYWEMSTPSIHPGDPVVAEHLKYFIDRARCDSRILWRTVGDIVCEPTVTLQERKQ